MVDSEHGGINKALTHVTRDSTRSGPTHEVMEIARLLTDDGHDSEAATSGTSSSSEQPEPDPMTTTSSLTSRSLQRAPRRPTKIESLRDHVKALQWLAANMNGSTMIDPLSETLEQDDIRMRQYLFKTRVLNQQAQHELHKRREYMEQLRQYQQSSSSLRKLMRGLALDEWFWKCERWRAISTEFYKPFSKKECHKLVEETLHEIATYQLPKGINGDKPSVFGWRDARGIGGDHQNVHFNARKTRIGSNLDDVVARCWGIYLDVDLFQQFVVGERTQLFFQVLQHETPANSDIQDMLVIHTIEKNPGLPTMVHSLYLMFLMKTKTGYVIGMRCIESPDLQRAMQGEGLSQGRTFYWTSWDVTARDKATGKCTEFVTSVTGTIGATDPSYAKKWVVEGLLVLVRLEGKLYGQQPLVCLPPPAAA